MKQKENYNKKTSDNKQPKANNQQQNNTKHPQKNTEKVEKKQDNTQQGSSRHAQNNENTKKKTTDTKKNKTKNSSDSGGRTLFTWAFVLLLILVGLSVLCFINKLRIQTHFQRLQAKADTLQYKYVFYKNAYQSKDSLYNALYTEYNNLIQKSLSESEELQKNKTELLQLQKELRAKDSILNAVENAVKQALVGYPSDELSVEVKDGKLYITMRNKLLFPSGSDKIPQRGYSALYKLATILKKNPNLEIMIEGHTDAMPISKKNRRFKDNWELSTARAIAVARVLIDKYGIVPERIEVAGRSKYYPIAPNTTPQGRAKNRRIEIILYPKLDYLAKIIGEE